MEDHHLGLVDNWLRNIRDVYVHSKNDLESMENLKARSNRLVELNVRQQVLNVCHTSIVQEAWYRKQPLFVHGWVYEMETGKVKDLNCCYSSIDQVDPIYRIKILSK